MRLEGKVALVTGGGSGIGAAAARRIAREGAGVVIMGRRAAPLAAVADEVGAVAVPGDASSTDDAALAVAAAVEHFGGLDVLVANAGGEGGGAAADADDATWDAGLRTNLTSCFVCARAALPQLVERRGAIVVVSSVAALAAGPGMAGYATAKAGLLGLMRSLAVDYGPVGVRVNAVCPGWIRTPMADREMDELASRRGSSRQGAYALATADVPLRRPGEADEIAAVCAFLASNEASYLTGSVIVADGGLTAADLGTLAFREES